MRQVNPSSTTSKTQHFTTRSHRETQKLGEELGVRLEPGALLALYGSLGAGKTTFVQGLAKGLGIAENVTSPTFVLMTEYSAPASGRAALAHLDAYRLEGVCYDAVRDAGVLDMLLREDAVKVIEWPECIADWLPQPDFEIRFQAGEDVDERQIEITKNQTS